MRRNTLTGKQVAESKLGKVPSAVSADAIGGVRAVRIAQFTLADAQSREILRHGPLTYNARCTTPAGGMNRAEIEVDTSVDNAAAQGDQDDADFDAADAPIDAVRASGGAGDPAFDQETDGLAVAPGGFEVFYRDLYAGVNVLGRPGVCTFGGAFGIG